MEAKVIRTLIFINPYLRDFAEGHKFDVIIRTWTDRKVI